MPQPCPILDLRLATFLASIVSAWDAATQEQRNRLVKQLFAEVVIQNKDVTKVKPRPELAGFFALDYAQRVSMYRTGGPDGVPCREFDTVVVSDLAQTESGFSGYFPVRAILSNRTQPNAARWSRLPPELWLEIQQRAKHESLRHLAIQFGVSHEAIRRIVNMKQPRHADRRRSA
jgi:hypothetical protein